MSTPSSTDDRDPVVLDPRQPRVADLLATYQLCSPGGGSFNRLTDAERVRFALWDNQSADCKKHGEGDFEAKPWEGASDQRVLLADDIINDDVDVLVNAFWRSLVKAEGTQVRDAAAAAVAGRVLYWTIRNKLNEQLQREVELAAQYQRTYGWVVVQVGWERRLGLRKLKLTAEQAVGLVPELEATLADPAFDDVNVALLQAAFAGYVAQELAEVDLESLPELSAKKARKAVKALREDGVAELAVPYLCRNQPVVRALQPWRDIAVPEEQGDLQEGQAFVRERLTEDALRARAMTEGYNEEWLELAVGTMGKFGGWEAAKASAHVHTGAYVSDTDDSRLIEVLTAYTTRLDEDGVPGVYVTVCSPHFTHGEDRDTELVAKHGLLDYAHGKMPFAASAAEWWCRSLTASRGVPERAYPQQRSIKVQKDAFIDWTTLNVLPPRLVPARMMDEDDEFGPASRIPINRGEEPRYMETGGNPGACEQVVRLELEEADNRFGRISAAVPPVRAQNKQQRMVNGFLSMWNEVFQQMWALMQQYLTAKEFEAVAGVPKPPFDPGRVQAEAGLILQTDVRDQDMDFALKKLQMLSQFVLPEDAAGIVDKSQWVRMKLMAVDPLLAQSVLVSDASASQKLFQQVSDDFNGMFLGNPPRLVENDPTAGGQLQFAQKVVAANPTFQKELMMNQEGRFAQAVDVWAKNRMQSQTQQENKTVGRLGVKPLENQG